MEQRDHLKKQIDLLGKVLGKILADLLGQINKGQVNEGIEITDQKLKDELNLDLENLASIPTDNFIETLKKDKGFNDENLDLLADIFSLLADNRYSLEKRVILYEKSLTIYEYLEKTQTTFSLDRQFKIKKIKDLLNS